MFTSVSHPTEYATHPAATRAFMHALAIALRYRSTFSLIHVGPEHHKEVRWNRFPGIHSTLQMWGKIEPGSPRSEIFDRFGVKVKKVALNGSNPTTTILEYLDKRPTDLIVVYTEGREGVSRFARPSVAEPLARESQTVTLFLPEESEGFVSQLTGKATLHRILVPVDSNPSPEAAVYMACTLSQDFTGGTAEVIRYHVGPERSIPETPLIAGIKGDFVVEAGEVVPGILEAAARLDVDLIVMATAGHEGFLDALRGSTTEQVVRKASCPVLAVPKTWKTRT